MGVFFLPLQYKFYGALTEATLAVIKEDVFINLHVRVNNRVLIWMQKRRKNNTRTYKKRTFISDYGLIIN